ncbi:hypothetical protein RclHR1_12220015 [Rhizophagus clarus]|uniref:Uncharacterized protein n=1 Tax=Rhizophagus clarus TaxID=94130 RepID=A0A2Z6QBE0_9GLOM|nr:hypothetical protein RclHR1_12220015 [Rhizophagus clarus]
MDELKYELFNPPSESDGPSSINHNNVTEVSETVRPRKVTYDSIDEASQHLAQDQLDEIIRSNGGKFGEKKVRSVLYDTITEQLSILRKKRSQELGLKLSDVSRDSLRKKTQRAEKNYKLFKKVGLDKIKYIDSYSANSISELTDAQFQEIIDYGIFLEKLSPEAGHVSEISETARPEKILPEINTPSTPQITPAKADDNDLTDLKEEDFCGGEVVIASVSSAYQSKPDHSYFRNKILDQYPNLYRECTCENFDYYGIADEASCGDYICPLCKLGHDDEEIEGEYKAGSYFIKCEQREIEITA